MSTNTTDLRGAKGGIILPKGDALGITYTFTNEDGSAYTGLSGTMTMFLKVGTGTVSLSVDDGDQGGGIITGTLTGTQSRALADGRYPLLLVGNQGASNQKTWAATTLTITPQAQASTGDTTSQTQSVTVVDGVAGVPVTVLAGPTGPTGATGATGATGPERPVLTITEEDFDAASPIYFGGTWSDDGAWQVTKSVNGTQTRATIANNSGVANLAAAWTARASLTYA